MEFSENLRFQMALHLPLEKTHGLGQGRQIHAADVHEIFNGRCPVFKNPLPGFFGFAVVIRQGIEQDDFLHLPAGGGGRGVTAVLIQGVEGLFLATQGFNAILRYFLDFHIYFFAP